MVSEDGTNWTVWSPVEQSRAWIRALTFSGDTFIAAGDNGLIMTARDGKTWRRQRGPLANEFLQIVAGGNGKFVVFGARQAGGSVVPLLLQSSDGLVWNEPADLKGFFSSIAFGNDTFVAVGRTVDQLGFILTSEDGAAWTTRVLSAAPDLPSGVTFGNGIFVGYGNGISTSSNGFDWIKQPNGLPAFVDRVISGDGQFLAFVGWTTYTSADGVTWVVEPTPTPRPQFNDVAFGGGLYVGVGDQTFSSLDGVRWQPRSRGNGDAVTYGQGRFIVGAGYLMQSAPVVSLTAKATPSGAPVISLNAELGLNVVVESSLDLFNWTPLKTFTTVTNSAELLDESASFRHRFYRVRSGPL